MAVDPNIIFNAVQQQQSGNTPFQNLNDIITFQNLLENQRLRKLKIEEDAKARQKQQTLQDLYTKNISPTQTGVQLNQPQFLQDLAKLDPAAALEYQSGFQKQQIESQINQQKEREALASADLKTLEKASSIQEMIGKSAGAVLNAPEDQMENVLNNQIDFLIDQGVISVDMLKSGVIPTSINPQTIAQLQGIMQSSLSTKDQIDAELNERKFQLSKIDTFSQIQDRVKKLSKQNFDQESDLRKEFTNLSKPFILQRDAFNRIEQSAKNPSAAGDLALIFNYMKILDPGSTVREGEFATAQNAAGVPERIRAQYKKVFSGERLTEKQRNDFVERSKKLFAAANNNQNKLESEFKKLSKQNDLNSRNVIVDFRSLKTDFNSVEEAEAANLPVGTEIIINGRRAVVE